MSGSKCALGGNGRYIYDDHNALVALKVPDQHDRMSQFAENHLGHLFKVRKAETIPRTRPKYFA